MKKSKIGQKITNRMKKLNDRIIKEIDFNLDVFLNRIECSKNGEYILYKQPILNNNHPISKIKNFEVQFISEFHFCLLIFEKKCLIYHHLLLF